MPIPNPSSGPLSKKLTDFSETLIQAEQNRKIQDRKFSCLYLDIFSWLRFLSLKINDFLTAVTGFQIFTLCYSLTSNS